MAKKITFNDRLEEFLSAATEAELHSAASQIALAIRLRFPNVAKPAKKRRAEKPAEVLAS
jgi:hypothetical protein